MQNNKRQVLLFRTTMVLMSVYLLWRVFFTLPLGQGVWNMVFALLLVGAETVTVLTTFELFVQKMKKQQGLLALPDIPPEDYPEVDVFIATHNEPVDLLYKTVNACTFLDYPDKAKVHIYLCDDGARAEVEALAKELGVGYLGLSGNKHAKSGNLNNALGKTASPLIATFDADMIPQRSFLIETVPYFLLPQFVKDNGIWRRRRPEEACRDFKIGLVQTPQSFYNPDLFQFNLYAERDIPNEQDFFSREVNILRNASGAVAYTGSNAVLCRRALEEIGGFPRHTITEDFETSIRLQQAGYVTYATQEVQAAGLSTTTIPGMLRQRTRWARGILQSLQNTGAIFSKKLSVSARITYLCSLLYWWSFFHRLIFILAPILFALFDFQIVRTGFWPVVVFWLPSYFCYSLSMRYLSGNIRNQRWSQVIDTVFMPYLILPVLLEALHIRETKFKVTNKKGQAGSGGLAGVLYALPHLLLLVLSAAAMLRFVHGKYGLALLYSSIILFWLAHNMVALCYALFFMLGRRVYRRAERIQAQEAVTVSCEAMNLRYAAQTLDVSEGGLALYVPGPIYLPEERDAITLDVKTARYAARLTATLVYVKKEGTGWRCAVSVRAVREADKRQYLQIIHDRHHSLPRQMNLWDTAYDDMLRNVRRRLTRPLFDRRKMPRIALQHPVVFESGERCTLRSFNFRYFSAAGLPDHAALAGRLTFYTAGGIEVVLRAVGRTAAKPGEVLLSVENMDDLVRRGQMDALVGELLHKTRGGANRRQPAAMGTGKDLGA